MFTRTTAAMVLAAATSFAHAVDTNFTYQGVLQDNGRAPANGSYDIFVYLYDAPSGGINLGTDDNQNVNVVDGRFTLDLDFGPDFYDGEDRWLRIYVRPGASTGSYTELTPRQPITAAPHAQHAETADLLQTRAANGVLAVESLINSEAGEFIMRRTDGTVVVDFGPDAGTPSGGEMKLYNNSGSQTFDFDGDINETGSGYFWMNGSAGTINFDLDFGSVNFPNDSINDYEIQDEPGVASATNGNSVTVTSTSFTTILSRTINCPSSGYVLVIGTTQPNWSHVNGTTSSYNVGVSDSSTSLPSNQDVAIQIPASNPSGAIVQAHTVHGLFQVSSGANTFYLLGEKISSLSPDCPMYDSQLTCIYFPTSYGTVTSTLLNSETLPEDPSTFAPGLTGADIAAEQQQSVEAYKAQVAAEIAEIREEVEMLRQLRGEEAAKPQPKATDDSQGE